MRVEISRSLHTEVLTVFHPCWWDLGFVFHCALSLFSKYSTIYATLLL